MIDDSDHIHVGGISKKVKFSLSTNNCHWHNNLLYFSSSYLICLNKTVAYSLNKKKVDTSSSG